MAKGRAALLLAVGSLAGAILWRRRSGPSRERVDLYFADGSMVSFAEGTPEAERLLVIARPVLARPR
jgi:hypothetical protein